MNEIIQTAQNRLALERTERKVESAKYILKQIEDLRAVIVNLEAQLEEIAKEE